MGIGYLWILECNENNIQKVVWNKGKLGSHMVAKFGPQIQTSSAIATQWMVQVTLPHWTLGAPQAPWPSQPLERPQCCCCCYQGTLFPVFFVQQLTTGSLRWIHVIGQAWVKYPGPILTLFQERMEKCLVFLAHVKEGRFCFLPCEINIIGDTPNIAYWEAENQQLSTTQRNSTVQEEDRDF